MLISLDRHALTPVAYCLRFAAEMSGAPNDEVREQARKKFVQWYVMLDPDLKRFCEVLVGKPFQVEE